VSSLARLLRKRYRKSKANCTSHCFSFSYSHRSSPALARNKLYANYPKRPSRPSTAPTPNVDPFCTRHATWPSRKRPQCLTDLVSLRIASHHLDSRSPRTEARPTHTEHHRELVDAVFKTWNTKRSRIFSTPGLPKATTMCRHTHYSTPVPGISLVFGTWSSPPQSCSNLLYAPSREGKGGGIRLLDAIAIPAITWSCQKTRVRMKQWH